MKQCIKCDNILSLDHFHLRSDSNKYRDDCNPCRAEYARKYRLENKDKVKSSIQKHYRKNKKSILDIKKTNYQDPNERAKIRARQKRYDNKSKHKIREMKKKYYHTKLKNDPKYKLRKHCSRTISRMITSNGSSNNSSILDYLPYTIDELKEHLESKFEPWMNWKNYGRSSTDELFWTIDHIVPQSLLKYSSMEDKNFQKCWALKNLQPLESVQNIKKSNKV